MADEEKRLAVAGTMQAKDDIAFGGVVGWGEHLRVRWRETSFLSETLHCLRGCEGTLRMGGIDADQFGKDVARHDLVFGWRLLAWRQYAGTAQEQGYRHEAWQTFWVHYVLNEREPFFSEEKNQKTFISMAV